jgi:transcriptional regulator with XRE-family HTH domain
MVRYKKIRSVLYMTGKKIRELRKANNLTMSELAKRSGTASSYISDLENEKIKNPSGIKLRKIAEALGVSTDDLLGKKIKPFIPETLYKGKEYTKNLHLQLFDLHTKKNKYKDIDNVLKNSPIEVIEYIDILKEITEKTEEYYKQIEYGHTIEKNNYKKIINEIRKLSSSIPSIDNKNE